MARYDRIARIEPPARDESYSGWLTLRDLEGRERDPELGRRARLHFVALRPVRRLLIRGLDGPGAGSLDSQLDVVREQVDQLSREGAERDRLSRYVEEIGGRSPSGMVRATLEVGTAAEAAGQRYAAEEFYRTALELAEAHSLDAGRVAALRHLGRVQREGREWDSARASLEASATLADELGDPVEWARSMEALAAVHLRSGDIDGAREVLDRISESPRASATREVRAIAAVGRCALELARSEPEAALAAGWLAATILPAQDEARNGVLLNMAAAFRHLGLGHAAASCYDIVMRWAAWPEHRIEARLEHAVVAAETGDAELFATRRTTVLGGLDHVDRQLQAMVHLGLGRGALLVDDTETARAHAREAIAMARDTSADEVLQRSEELLSMVEQRNPWTPTPPNAPSNDARQIAASVAELGSGA